MTDSRAFGGALVGLALLLAAGLAPSYAAPAPAALLAAARAAQPDLMHGASLFKVCAGCHGRDGGAVRGGSVPAIAGQQDLVLLQALVEFRYSERWDPRMAGVAGNHQLHSAQAIADVAAYVASLPWVARVPGAEAIVRPLDARSAGLYARACAACHGARGRGGPGVPRLAGQHRAYLLQQLNAAAASTRADLTTHRSRLGRLDGGQRRALAVYLTRLGEPGQRAHAGTVTPAPF